MPTAKPTNPLQSLEQQLNDPQSARTIPPLENWHPTVCGDMDMVVTANGEWWHGGAKVTRQSLVDLFAKVLWAEVDENNHVDYYLKTPVEKLRIHVEDAPLLITQVDQITEQGMTWLEFTTSQGDKVKLDNHHPLQFGLPFGNASAQSKQQPYLLVRQNGESALYGLIHRNVFYHLVAMGELVSQNQLTLLRLYSGDQIIELSMPADEV